MERYISANISAIDSSFFNKNDTGLGNVLFQFASVYGISKTLGIQCTFPRIKKYIELLKLNFNYDHGSTILRNIPIINDEIVFENISESVYSKNYDVGLVNYIKESRNNIMVHGYLENNKYFSVVCLIKSAENKSV
jgi:hypothetical protein